MNPDLITALRAVLRADWAAFLTVYTNYLLTPQAPPATLGEADLRRVMMSAYAAANEDTFPSALAETDSGARLRELLPWLAELRHADRDDFFKVREYLGTLGTPGALVPDDRDSWLLMLAIGYAGGVDRAVQAARTWREKWEFPVDVSEAN